LEESSVPVSSHSIDSNIQGTELLSKLLMAHVFRPENYKKVRDIYSMKNAVY
jgi:hypothetical protein